ncbi:MAG: MmcQ/YjbR family DNA-binding protein [Alphaproteobacteria bacterium]|nr:MmcQ/YjbR family DNA-binding protein [Alphaproteobacteria bacterium]
MKYAEVEKFCLSLPGAKLSIQWGADHVYKVGDKMFAVLGPPDAKPQTMSFKTGDDSFAILTKEKNIIPAPYLARAKWVQLEKLDALGAKDLKAYLTRAHALIAAGLTKKKRAELGIAV